MRVSKKQYAQMAEKASPKSNLFIDCIKAFLVGGLICTIGQGLTNIYTLCGMELLDARTLTSVSLVFLGALLTSIGVYDRIAKHAGAGSLVPITGFANSIVAPAIEFKSEGFVLGLGAKMFIIAGPVLVYGITASVLWGVIYFILKLTGVMQ
ncbi:MAG TPA: stage V sporulation protein AC [Candidatus Scatavimonas merdigallinarum]|uniref:Stage V sporulation protein AC n=1 Tax=Candidatus Scatavimonas merdigallinarum TaxID=2840914 RepID=A0A9D0ZIN0_9FIRM|nr:stage V sporulation protein AC [Candidatus Scatavimonas merdigallinarum]